MTDNKNNKREKTTNNQEDSKIAKYPKLTDIFGG